MRHPFTFTFTFTSFSVAVRPLAVMAFLAVCLSPPAAQAIEPDAPELLISEQEGLAFSIRQAIDRLPAVRGDAERSERVALQRFYAGGDAGLQWVGSAGLNSRARALVKEIRAAGSWGLRPEDFVLPDANGTPGGQDWPLGRKVDTELVLARALLKYARHARGGRLDPTRMSLAFDRKPVLLAPLKVLQHAAAHGDVAAYLRSLHPQHRQFQKLRAAYARLLSGAADEADIIGPYGDMVKVRDAGQLRSRVLAKLLANMEMWRWMPEQLGERHVWANVPSYEFAVMNGEHVMHAERMVVGKPANMTPIFSDHMETVVFQPYWAVPNSIKIKELLPRLLRGSGLKGLKISRSLGGQEINPGAVNWHRQDIRNYVVYQPPGRSNALGRVKFMFPNRHAIYMHDTPHKHLFKHSRRAYSHGCLRVRDPLKLAEVLLSSDRGWGSRKIAHLTHSGPENNEIKLQSRLPVHVAYFTAQVSSDGRVQYFDDVYGHERTVHLGLAGKTFDLAPPQREELTRVRAQLVSSVRPRRRDALSPRFRSTLGAPPAGVSVRVVSQTRSRPQRSRAARRAWRSRVFSGSGN
jgi:murein L,D-transpeptidase YcbB/YkuD